ncbi:MAG: acetyl-CoA decarbonylase/synthase complex subunit delta [Candidatus Humimicrobiaceae bacterium]
MEFQIPLDEYSGAVNLVKLGKDNKEITVGGDSTLPFYSFDKKQESKPIIAIEIYDEAPANWPDCVSKYYSDVLDDPVLWAKKAIADFGADAVCLQLKSLANDEPADYESLAELALKLNSSIDKPLIVYGDGTLDRISEALKKISEKNPNTNMLLGFAEEDNYKTVGAASIGYGNNLIASNPLDVNIAKQINILLTQLGLPADRIIMDPSSSSVGYGIEYSVSCIERLKIAAVLQNDKMTQMPIINNLAKEVWKTKEVMESEEDYPNWGDQEKRAINFEVITAISLMIAGSNILVMRHPKAISIVKEVINELY